MLEEKQGHLWNESALNSAQSYEEIFSIFRAKDFLLQVKCQKISIFGKINISVGNIWSSEK